MEGKKSDELSVKRGKKEDKEAIVCVSRGYTTDRTDREMTDS